MDGALTKNLQKIFANFLQKEIGPNQKGRP